MEFHLLENETYFWQRRRDELQAQQQDSLCKNYVKGNSEMTLNY